MMRSVSRIWSPAFYRLQSTLAGNSVESRLKQEKQTPTMSSSRNQKDQAEVEEFREMFLKPSRKLSAQLKVEHLTGRGEVRRENKRDVSDRLAVRHPRRDEMAVDQDWPSIWPVAQSFRASVVPFSVRMGTRKRPENRSPFKTFGNLELLKIPNFLHLTPTHISRHCESIKKYCTPFPEELKKNPAFVDKHLPVIISYSDFVHQSNSIRDMRSRIVTVFLKVSTLRLDAHAKDKLRRLAGDRYDKPSDTLAIVTDRCFTRKQNRDYTEYLLTVLYHESNKLEEWEKKHIQN